MENKFTGKAQNALTFAVNQAQNFGHTYIGSEHLLLGLIEERESVASRMLFKRGITLNKIKNDILSQTGSAEKTVLSSSDITPKVRKIIENSSKLSEKNKQELIGSEHLLYSLLSEDDCLTVRLLEQNGLYVHEMKADVLNFIQISQKMQKNSDQKKRDGKNIGIDMFARNLIDMASSGKSDPTFCRDKETERVIQILSRRTKNNPCLIGEPGVGKTAVVEGLALRIATGNVPPSLQRKIIYALDVPSLIAGAKYRGEFEERMKSIMGECLQNPNIILFIDEIHTIIGAGSAEGAIDAANILKPALSRGEIQIIGATTIAEYRKHIERDSALERRFQPIMVNEPSASDAQKILFGLKDRYENHHGLIISDEAILGAVELSQKYISDRFLPDKAIDLIDEAAARVKIKGISYDRELNEVQSTIDTLLAKKEKAIIDGDINKAHEYSEQISSIKEKNNNTASKKSNSKSPTVTYEDIADIVKDWTGIPVSRLLESESNKLNSLEGNLKSVIIGQDKAISLISQSIRRGRIGIKNAEQPTGSFIFIGPSGVGKTELCLALADILFGSKKALLRFDMSEYMEKHSVSKLIGAPPGYVGYGEGGLLTEKIRRNPYSIVLFDEIEKAHPDVFNVLLQILDEGALTDSQGRYVSFKNTLIVMTSNLGSVEANERSSLGFFNPDNESIREKEREKRIKKALENTFRPEFLNRIDEIVIFNSLTKENIEQISKLMLNSLSERIEKLGIKIKFDKKAQNLIIKEAFDERSGARKLKGEIRRLVENPLSSEILAGNIKKGDKITVTEKKEKIAFIK